MSEEYTVAESEVLEEDIKNANNRKGLSLHQILFPVMGIILVIIIFNTVFLLGIVPTPSMAPTIEGDGNLILAYRLSQSYSVGDVVVFKHDDRLLVKRIAFVGGDTILLDGENVTVPENSFFLLGDNSTVSYDSRMWDKPFVSIADIVGKVVLPSCKNPDAEKLREPFIVDNQQISVLQTELSADR